MANNYREDPLDSGSSRVVEDISKSNNNHPILKVIFHESNDPRADEVRIKEALKVLHECPGENQVNLEVLSTKKTVLLSYDFNVDGNYALKKVEELLGPNTCVLV